MNDDAAKAFVTCLSSL